MYERMKVFCINIMIIVGLIAAFGSYMIINSVIVVRVINDLQLDTYVGIDTGLGIVMLILLLGWVPVWLIYSQGSRRRYVGRL